MHRLLQAASLIVTLESQWSHQPPKVLPESQVFRKSECVSTQFIVWRGEIGSQVFTDKNAYLNAASTGVDSWGTVADKGCTSSVVLR